MSIEPAPYRRAELPIEQRISDLLARMTLEEKLDQLHQCGVGDTNPNNVAARADMLRPGYGSFILNGTGADLATRNAIQRRCLTESRLGIPALFGSDVIHGYRAITPIPLAQACSWNPELVGSGAAMAAEMAHAQGVDWTFAPMVDFCVDPRWGRIAETFGESPHASSVFGAASVRGYQGPKLGGPGSLAACLKHYVGYGASEGGRDYSATDIPPQKLWEYHLPAFAAGVRAGARSVMSAFNDLNGVPTSANRYTLTEILRERWGFDGLVVSDWNAVLQLLDQGYAADEAEAVKLALEAGVDLDMCDGLYRKHGASLVAAKMISIARIDEAVRRVLRVKFELGLFEHPLTEPSSLTDSTPVASQLSLCERLAAESMVLLKNDGLLPLDPRGKRITLIGPLADASTPLLGSWAQHGLPDETQTLLAAFREKLPAGARLTTAPGCSLDGKGRDDFPAALALVRESDLAILCLGEEAWMSGENASRSSLRLPGRQEEFAKAVAETGKPVVLVLITGRPVEISSFEDRMSAILAAWQGGTRAAAAVADILLGARNPCGRLSVTWPRSTGQIPLYHNMRPRARQGQQGEYQDIPTTPLYAFGHGLSYSAFSYGELRLNRTEVPFEGTLQAEITVTNTGRRSGAEAVFWFIRDPAASITRPLKELKHFEKAEIPSGGSHVFHFEVVPARDLTFPDANGHPVLEAGEIQLSAGPKSVSFQVIPQASHKP